MDQQNFIGSQKEKLSFRDIVLGHIKKILEISSHELKEDSTRKFHSVFVETIEKEDTRLSYIQSIENLAYILLPYFDNKMKKVYNRCIKIINSWNFELVKMYKEEMEDVCKEAEKTQKEVRFFFCMDTRLREAKKLFSELNLLLHRQDYLKGRIYGEEEKQ